MAEEKDIQQISEIMSQKVVHSDIGNVIYNAVPRSNVFYDCTVGP